MELESQDIFLTSDTFFGREQILQIGKRHQFGSIKEMERTLISNWNSVVREEDLVFHLGNFAWDPVTARRVLKQLNGHIVFLPGHCDDALGEAAVEFDSIDIIDDQIITVPEHDLVLCHYPLLMWPGKDSGTIHVHGHAIYSHKTNLEIERRINICTDYWSYSPVKLSTLKDLINEANERDLP